MPTRQIVCSLLVCLLALSACASPAAEEKTKPTPPKNVVSTPKATPDDLQGTAIPLSTPGIGEISPANLPLDVLAWGSPTDGLSGALPQAVLLKAGEQPDPAWLQGLPAVVQSGLQSPGTNEWFLLLYGGAQACPAYHIGVQSAMVVERTLKVTWQVLPPDANTGCAAVIAYPYLILRLKEATQYVDGVEFLP